MTLYLIDTREEEPYQYLKQSAEEKNISVKRITSQREIENLEHPVSSDDIVYRTEGGERMRAVEGICIMKGATPLASPARHTIQWSTQASEIQGTRFIPQRRILEYDETLIERFVSELEGYPVVLKILGHSHGEGVKKCNFREELKEGISSVDFETQVVYLKRYIESDGHLRVIVLGDRVLGAIKYIKPGHDFRTNLRNSVSVEPASIDASTAQLAIRAVHNENHVFGGVDVILDTDKTPYVMEMNTPCYFPRVQDALNVDISGEIIEYLTQKASRNQSMEMTRTVL